MIRFTVHLDSQIGKNLDIDANHLLLRSVCDAPNLNKAFLQPHSNAHQLAIREEVTECLSFKFDSNIVAVTHLAYPGRDLDKFSGTGPDQHAESFKTIFRTKT